MQRNALEAFFQRRVAGGNPKWDERTMSTKDGTLLGFQDLETWEFCVPSA